MECCPSCHAKPNAAKKIFHKKGCIALLKPEDAVDAVNKMIKNWEAPPEPVTATTKALHELLGLVPNEVIKQCSTCRHFRPSPHHASMSQCRRYPPVAREWSTVGPTEGCGEWDGK